MWNWIRLATLFTLYAATYHGQVPLFIVELSQLNWRSSTNCQCQPYFVRFIIAECFIGFCNKSAITTTRYEPMQTKCAVQSLSCRVDLKLLTGTQPCQANIVDTRETFFWWKTEWLKAVVKCWWVLQDCSIWWPLLLMLKTATWKQQVRFGLSHISTRIAAHGNKVLSH